MANGSALKIVSATPGVVFTNNLEWDGSIGVESVSPINPNSTNIVAQLTSLSTLVLSWPTDTPAGGCSRRRTGWSSASANSPATGRRCLALT